MTPFQHAAEWLTFEQAAEFQVFVEHVEAFIPAQALGIADRTPRSMPVVRAPRLKL
jgi:hypothetical protein